MGYRLQIDFFLGLCKSTYHYHALVQLCSEDPLGSLMNTFSSSDYNVKFTEVHVSGASPEFVQICLMNLSIQYQFSICKLYSCTVKNVFIIVIKTFNDNCFSNSF